eukprot:GDKI01045139.1.p1 GENE.GDKI01045139.1~~GDKI01045139.1.p1  ORF type:complete len:194 (-),score=54.56 GDKI01045139.1:292-873(-)
MTTCQKAIQLWEEKQPAENKVPAAEAEVVKLLCQTPPIAKMDASLNTLAACKQLSLSTNQIGAMINLPGLKNLEILSLGRNAIKRISGLDEVGATLKQLWISYNQIEKLDGLQPCVKLEVLFISNNKIKAWEEVEKLANLPNLCNVLFKGNPMYDGRTLEQCKCSVLKRVPNLKTIDGEMVTDQLKEKSASAE